MFDYILSVGVAAQAPSCLFMSLKFAEDVESSGCPLYVAAEDAESSGCYVPC
jgi:hypothetical protein